MISYLRNNLQLYLILAFWLATGIFAGPATYVVVPLTMMLLFSKGMYEELLIGYLFILILSDSLEDQLLFAKSVKNIYISLLSVFFFVDSAKFFPLNNLYRIFMPFFIFSVFTMMFSVTDAFFFTSAQKTLSYFLTFLVVPAIVLRVYREKGPEFLKNLIMFLLFTLILGILLRFVSYDLVYIESGRFRGVLGNPNGLAIYCLLAFLCFFIIADRFPDMFSRGDKIIFYIVVFYSILISDSRNAIIGVMIFYVFQRFFAISPFLGFIFFLGFIAVAEVISANLANIILYFGLGDYFRVETLEEGSGRYIAWDFAWKQIQQNFFIGKGFAYNEYYMRQHYDLLNKLGHQGGIHNSFLTFWMDQGLIGLLIYLRSYILMFIQGARQSRFAFPVMFSISFTAIFESWLVGSLSAFAFLAMIIYTLLTSEELAQPENATTNEELTEDSANTINAAIS